MTEQEKKELARFIIGTRDGVVKIVESRFNAILAQIAPEMLDPLSMCPPLVPADPWDGTPLWEVDVAQFHGLWTSLFNGIYLRLQWPEHYDLGMKVRLRPYPRKADSRELLMTIKAYAALADEGYLIRFDEVARRGSLPWER